MEILFYVKIKWIFGSCERLWRVRLILVGRRRKEGICILNYLVGFYYILSLYLL